MNAGVSEQAVKLETYTVADLSEVLDFTVNRCYELIAEGRIPGVIRFGDKPGSHIRISRRAIDKMLEQGTPAAAE